MEWTIYVDLDAFYVACELRDRPDLVGRPVIVGPDPNRGPTRGVVLSASYEARRFGARSAMPAARAAALVPDAVWLRPDHAKYSAISSEVFDRLRTEVPELRPRSIDEAAIPWEAPDAGSARGKAAELQRIIEGELHLSASVGVATHPTVAKIASDRDKPHGLTVVPADGIRAFLAPLPARAIPGIGPKTAERLEAIGVRTIDDLVRAERPRLRSALGGFTGEVLELALGHPRSAPSDRSGPQLRSTDHTFAEDVRDLERLREELGRMAPDLTTSLRREGYRAGSVGIGVRWEDFTRVTRTKSLPHAVDDAEAVAATADRLLRELWALERRGRARGVRTLSLRLERLRPDAGRQVRLDALAGPDPAFTNPTR